MESSKFVIFGTHFALLLTFAAAHSHHHHHHGHHHHHHHHNHHHGHHHEHQGGHDHHHGHHHEHQGGHDHHHDHHGGHDHHHGGHDHQGGHDHHHGSHDHHHNHPGSHAAPKSKPAPISAVYAFGDSSVDTGNNNINYNTAYRSDHFPYGLNFPYQAATGRPSNGKLIVDYIVASLGIKDTLTAYLDPNRKDEDLATGISYGLSGTGLDIDTGNKNYVPSMEQELISFEHTIQRMVDTIGENRTREIVKDALFIISVGTNDMIDTYYDPTSTVRLQGMDVQTYHDNLIERLREILERLANDGARRFMVFGMPPVGCLPRQVISLANLIPSLLYGRDCLEDQNTDAQNYNAKLQDYVVQLNKQVKLTHIEFVNIYTPMAQMIYNPNNFGFDSTMEACCGVLGIPMMGGLCNGLTPLCPNPDRYFFWDSINPTQAANADIAYLIETQVLNKFV